MSALEERGLNCIIAARACTNLKNEIYGMNDWVEVCPGIAVKEWRHQPVDPKAKARRHIVVRKQISRPPQAGGKLPFDDLPDYRFSLHVTNLDLPLDQVWNIHNSRADCEYRIRELKQGFGLEPFCLQDFWATEASFRFIMVAYNLMSLFRHFGLSSHSQATLATLRSYCFAKGGWVQPARPQPRAQALTAAQKGPLNGHHLLPNRSPPACIRLTHCIIRDEPAWFFRINRQNRTGNMQKGGRDRLLTECSCSSCKQAPEPITINAKRT